MIFPSMLMVSLVSVAAFSSPQLKTLRKTMCHMTNKFDESGIFDPSEKKVSSKSLDSALLASAVYFLIPATNVLAKDGEFGILEGRTFAMIHPITMLILFGVSAYSGYLGLQWRKLREIGNEIRDLNSQLPTISSGKIKTPVIEAISAIKSEISSLSGLDTEDAKSKVLVLQKDLAIINSPAVFETSDRIVSLTADRKSLQGQDLRDRHWNTGSALLGVGVGVSLLGGLDTYFRAGKLFPGPHLFAGVAITGLWAAAAALVPAMQKGNESARVAHIALNVVIIALFAWQLNTGLDIMIKVWGFTKWP